MKFKVLEAFKNSIVFYRENLENILLIYFPFFIANFIISILFKIDQLFLIYSTLEYLLVLLIMSIFIYPFQKTTIYLYFYNKDVKKAYLESLKYYPGILLIVLFNVFSYLMLTALSVFLSTFISSTIFILTNNFELFFYSYFISFTILTLIFYVIINKFFISSPLYMFEKKKIVQSLRESWNIIDIKNSFKIYILQLLLYSLAIVILVAQQIYYKELFIFKLIDIFTSVYIIIPITNIFSLYLYEQYKNYSK
ncbi:MAG: hypothetical protein ACP5G1_03525 [Nanopusillaceae archaeon]